MMKTILGFLAVALLATGVAMAVDDVKIYKWDVNEPIPDNMPDNPLVNTQTVFDSAEMLDVDVDLWIEHTWQGDLIVDISHGGVTVPLLYRAGDSNGVGAGFSDDNFGTADDKFILDDEADAPYDGGTNGNWGNIPDTGIPNVSGRWIPYGMFDTGGIGGLGAFDGMDKLGDWTLTVSDNAGGDQGVLLNWSLHIQNVPEPAFLMPLALCGLPLLRRRRR